MGGGKLDFINYLCALELLSVVVDRFHRVNIVYDIVAMVVTCKIVEIKIKLFC